MLSSNSKSMEDQNPPTEFYISSVFSRFGIRSCNFYLASLSLERERSVNIFYSNRRGVSFTNWKEIENHVSE